MGASGYQLGGELEGKETGGDTAGQGETMNLIWAVIAVLVVLWAAGLAMHVAGGLIHFLLVFAAILFVVRMFMGGATRV